MILRIGMWTLKTGAVWVALIVGAIASGMLVGAPSPQAPPDGPLTSETAFLVVNGVHAAVLAALAAQARIRGAALAFFLFAILFGAQTFLMQIETVFFNEHFGLSLDAIARGALISAIGAAFGAAMAALVFRPAPEAPPALSGLIWRFPAAAAAYVCCYYAAGIAFVVGSAAAREFYDGFTGFPVEWVPVLQFGRGMVWALLALLIVRNLKGPLAMRAAMAGLALSVFGAVQLLYPNPFMPWPVRFVHMIEIGISNAAFGALAAVLLGARWPAGGWMKRTGASA